MCISKHCFDIINVENIIDQLSDKQLSIEELPFDPVNLLYLDTAMADKLIDIAPIYMKKKGVNISDFVIGTEAKVELSLSAEYQSINALLNSMDRSLIDYLRNNFGIENINNSMCSDALLLNNKAFIEFENDGSIQGIVLELDSTKSVKIALVYMLID
jgi:hypothetical protein